MHSCISTQDNASDSAAPDFIAAAAGAWVILVGGGQGSHAVYRKGEVGVLHGRVACIPVVQACAAGSLELD